MVGAILVEDLLFARVEARHADGAVVGFAAAAREHEAVEVAGRQLGQERGQAGADRRQSHTAIGKRELSHLLVHGLLHLQTDPTLRYNRYIYTC